MIFQAETQAKIFLLNWAPGRGEEGAAHLLRHEPLRPGPPDILHLRGGRRWAMKTVPLDTQFVGLFSGPKKMDLIFDPNVRVVKVPF